LAQRRRGRSSGPAR